MATPPSLQSRLVEMWTWLPAFRAVAEVEHVQGAARALHITPSALSRAIRLVEEHLGKSLFDRVGRNLRLNHDGHAFLTAVRDGMRRIDDGIAEVTETVFAGELRIASEGDHPLELAWRAAARLMRQHPVLRTSVERTSFAGDVAALMLRGSYDVAIVSRPPSSSRVLVDPLGDVSYSVYCGPTHPLRSKRALDLATVRRYPFVAPTQSSADTLSDHWPEAIPRIVALRLPALASAIQVCRAGALLAVLPDRALVEEPRLHRLPLDIIPAVPLFAVRRQPTGPVDRAGAFVEELKIELKSTIAPRRQPRTAATR